jgi:hypothetical protein
VSVPATVAKTKRATEASGGKTRFAHVRRTSNQYLKLAFSEAVNVVVCNRRHPACKTMYVCQIYN